MSRKRTYDQTFRMEAVSLVNTSNKSIAAVARELDIPTYYLNALSHHLSTQIKSTISNKSRALKNDSTN